MYALDRSSGAVRWKRDMGSPIASSPAVATRRVFFGTRDGRFHALDAATGDVRWVLATGPDAPWPWGHESGDVYTSSPVYVNGTVIFGAGSGRVYAADATTGKERWRAATGGRVRSSPAVADGRVFVGAADGRVYAFDLATGALRWRYETEGVKLESRNFGYDRRTVQSSPAVSNGTVFVGARDGFLYAIDAASGQLRWRFDHKVSWVNTSPAVRDSVVYAGSSDGQFVQAVHARTGQELWRAKSAVTWSSPTVAGGVVYAGDGAGRVNAFDAHTGASLWSFRTGSQVYGSPVPDRDMVFVGSTDGSVYALRVGPGPGVHRAVFFDSAYIKSAWVADPALLSRYFVNRGYTLVDARGLGDFLEARTADRAPSVVVFAIDHLPPTAVDTAAPERSAFRRYLNAGGKVVWSGVPPLLFVKDPQTGKVGGLAALNWAAPTRLLGVDHEAAMFDLRGVHATAEGKRWGLPNRWRASWGIAADSTITVLGRDELGLTTSWVRRYGAPLGTGFVRVPMDDPMVVYLAAEYRPQ
jgi:outer membrane protein assembly factor BamB